MISTKDLHSLAIFGGKPTFAEQLHVGRPNIGNRERLMERISDMLDRRWLTNNGPLVQEFEQKLAQFLKVKHVIAMCNATVALEIAIRAIGLKGEVIIPSFTFIATAHALQWQEITPVFCDVAPGTHHINPSKIEELITPRTSGIIGVHVWGEACDIDSLVHIAQRRNLHIMFDAAHAFGCTYKGQMIGSFGDVEIFSFHATKFLNSFEGGAITTNNDKLADKLRYTRNFGFAGYDDVQYIGTNGKMSEVSAAMGLTSLESFAEFVAINRHHYKIYQQELNRVPGVRLYRYDENEQGNYQYVILEIDENVTRINRDHLVKVLWAENVLVRRYFYPGCHQMEPYRSYSPHSYLLLSNTEKLVKRVLSLPNGTAMDEEKVKQVCQLIRFAVEHGEEITTKLNP